MPTNSPGLDNPFEAVMAQAKTAGEEFTKMFTDMKFPGIPGAEAWLAAHRRNVEAMSAANRIALEGAQTVARRHMEILQQSMTEISDAMRSMGSSDSPQAKAARQTELLKRSYERAVANTKELGDLIQQANGEALGLLNKRFTEAMDEVKLLMDKSGKPG
jgi:phasin family protein